MEKKTSKNPIAMKKKFAKTGMVVGILFIVVGVLSILGFLGGATSTPTTAPYNYDSGYATFGGDYYTFSVNNSAEAASAARATANNVDGISDFLTVFCGLSSILFGVIVRCGFAIMFYSFDENTATEIANGASDSANGVAVADAVAE
jgi:hypothetical protein